MTKELEELIEQSRKKDVLADTRKTNKQLLRELLITQKRMETIVALDKEHRPQQIKASNKISSEATAVGLLSDIHAEEEVDPDVVNGLNRYNLKICEQSCKNFFANFHRLIEITGKEITIKDVVLGLLGDNISGYIHEELEESNLLSPTEATIMVYHILISGIDYLLHQLQKTSKHKINLKIICKIGNHGRTTKKRRVATAHKNSYEWMMYQFLADHYKDNDQVQIIVEKSYHTILKIYDYLIRFHHGDNIRYQGGVGGLTIPFNKAIAQWNKQYKVYLDVAAHYHTLMLDTGYGFVINGSVVGYNPYAISIKASFEPPQQGFFLMDKKRGKTLTAPIFVR